MLVLWHSTKILHKIMKIDNRLRPREKPIAIQAVSRKKIKKIRVRNVLELCDATAAAAAAEA